MHPKVFRFVAAAGSPAQTIQAAVLQVDASVASHESALHLAKVPRIPLVAAVTIAPRPSALHRGIRVHRLGDLIEASELPDPVPKYPLPSLDPGAQFVDRAWPEAKLILEVDGRAWHAREAAMAKDRARDRSAARMGWLTLRVLDEELDATPAAVIDDVLATYRMRLSIAS